MLQPQAMPEVCNLQTMGFPELSPELRAARLSLPSGRYRAVLDTDTANEIDDPFAIAHAVLSPDQIDLLAVLVAPFRRGGVSPSETIDLGVALAKKTLDACGSTIPVIPGAREFMDGPASPVANPASAAIRELAHSSDEPLYVLAIGALTNVASALLEDPNLVERVVVVWLGGHAPDYPNTREYNLEGDIHASRVVLASGVPLVLLPALGVTSHLLVSLGSLERDIEGTGPLGDLLTRLLRDYVPDHFGYEKEMWDVGVTAYMVNPAWMQSALEPTPGISEDLKWVRHPAAPLYRRVTYISRNAVLGDLFRKVASSA